MKQPYKSICRGCLLVAISATLYSCAPPSEQTKALSQESAPSSASSVRLQRSETSSAAIGSGGSSSTPPSAANIPLPALSAPFDPTASPNDLSCRPKLTLVPDPRKAVSLVLNSQGLKKKPPERELVPAKKAALVTDINGFPKMKPGNKYRFANLPQVLLSDPEGNKKLVGPVTTITIDHGHPLLGPDGKPVLGPVGLVEPTDLPSDLLDAQYQLIPVVGPVGTAALDDHDTAILDLKSSDLSAFDTIKVVGSQGEPLNKLVSEVMLPKPVLGAGGLPLSPMYGAIPPMLDSQCKSLSPLTRLIFENAGASSTYQYTNEAGLTNLVGGSPASTAQVQATNAYSVGVGYVNKPILKQILALTEPADGRVDVGRQGTLEEDFIYNALTLSASGGYGRTLQAKNGKISDAFTTRPFYSVSLNYGFDLERAYVHLFHSDARPADPGYYYEPNAGPQQTDYWPQPYRYNNDRPY